MWLSVRSWILGEADLVWVFDGFGFCKGEVVAEGMGMGMGMVWYCMVGEGMMMMEAIDHC